MTQFVLVHGSGQNASSWDLVRPLLVDAGHDVVTIELPKNEPEATGSDFAWRIAAQTGIGAVVVAHSASGMYLPIVAALRPVRALVYFAAVIPQPGVSLVEQFTRDSSMLAADWVAAGRQWFERTEWRDLADHYLFHDMPVAEREFAHTTVQPMRTDGAVREPSPIDTPVPVPSICVIATQDRTVVPSWQERVWRERAPGQPIVYIDAGHCPHVSRPRESAEAILKALQ